MSFRELRNFTEIMRMLGYPSLVSMENFRNPNFLLVSDILYWLVKRYDPTIEVSDNIETEKDRIVFLKSIAQIVYTRMRIKLNIKKLYGADGYAVKELLKLASLLKEASRMENLDSDGDNASGVYTKMYDSKTTRHLASELAEIGSSLYSLLAKEKQLREERYAVLSQPFEMEDVERSIKRTIDTINESTAELKETTSDLSKDIVTLESKIEKRTIELKRKKKSLDSLRTVRPAFMDEYDRLENELHKLYQIYVEKYRNLEYLDQELEKYHEAEKAMVEESNRKLMQLRKKLREEELRIMRGEQILQDDLQMAYQPKVVNGGSRPAMARPRAASGRRPGSQNPNVNGHYEDSGNNEDEEDWMDSDELESSGEEISVEETESGSSSYNDSEDDSEEDEYL